MPKRINSMLAGGDFIVGGFVVQQNSLLILSNDNIPGPKKNSSSGRDPSSLADQWFTSLKKGMIARIKSPWKGHWIRYNLSNYFLLR